MRCVQASAGFLEFGDTGRDAGAFLDEALHEVGFENLTGETIVTAIDADKPPAVIAPQDIGAAVAVAFADPVRFNEQVIELAGDMLSLKEMAVAFTAAGDPARVETVTAGQGKARGMLAQLMDIRSA